MIRVVNIKGFKSISDVSIDLGRFNCFIGANGAGKSNILEAMGVLGAAANGVVDDEALLRRGVRPGLPRLYKSSFDEMRTPPEIYMKSISDDSYTYSVSLLNPLENPNPAWKFKSETWEQDDADHPIFSYGVRGDGKKNVNPLRGLMASRLVDYELNSPEYLFALTLQNYAIYCPNTPTLRAMTPDQQSRSPVGLSGGRLALGLAELFDELGERQWLLDELADLIDWISDIDVTGATQQLLSPSAQRAKEVVRFTDRFMAKTRNTLTAYDASEGALYVIFAAILCLSKAAPPLLAIDNLDQALNPRLVTRLVQKMVAWLATKSPTRQILFTAHNPAVLDGLDLEDESIHLFAVDRDSRGCTVLNRIIISEQLKPRLKEYPLSRLWMMGALGAVPNV